MDKVGRKYNLTLICVAALVAAYAASGFFSSLQTTFGQFAMGLSGLLGLYCGGNIGSKYVTKKKEVEQGQ
jgi:hypothetical protein